MLVRTSPMCARTLCALVDVPTTVQRGPATPLPKNGTTAVQYTLWINQVHRLPTVARRVYYACAGTAAVSA